MFNVFGNVHATKYQGICSSLSWNVSLSLKKQKLKTVRSTHWFTWRGAGRFSPNSPIIIRLYQNERPTAEGYTVGDLKAHAPAPHKPG